MSWTLVDEKERNGVAIYNFFTSDERHLQLQIGDSVTISEQLGDWYYGFRTHDKSNRGVFPKSYVQIRDDPETQLPLVQETTAVLREWGDIFKHLYVTNSVKFKELDGRMYDLMRLRSEILSGTLPQDELREMEHHVAAKIDLGNHMLELDMVVRDADCNILNPENTSTVQLYWQHQKATEDIKKAKNDTQRRFKNTQNTNQFSHSLFLSVRNFVCKIGDEAELLISLYDGKENSPFTENYVVRWSHANTLHSLRVLFTDLGSRDLTREKIYLVCNVIRVGALDVKDAEKEMSRRSSVVPGKKGHYVSGTAAVRRPFGVAAMDLTLYMSGNLETDEEVDHFIPFIPCEKENLEQTLKRALIMRDIQMKDQGLWVSLKLLHGDIKQVREENPHLVLGNVSVSRKMGFPEVILPGDVRNDLYMTLVSGEFSKGSKNSDKNVQVLVTVCDESGAPIPNAIFLGGGVAGVTEFKSVVYYHEDKPKWNEIFKVAVPIEEFKSAHIKFAFKHRSSNEAKDKSEKPFAMAYVKLMQANGTTLPDSSHSLCVYRLGHKKWDESDIGYLALPCTKTELKVEKKEEKHSGLVLSSKDSFIISTNVCSTKLTQNVDLLGLLNWADNKSTLEHSLQALMQVDGEEVVKYLQDVLDALFNILMNNSDSELYDDIVFKCLLFIIGLVADRKYQHFEPVLDVYIQESFSATLAYNKLMITLKNHIDNACNNKSDPQFSLKVMKSLQYIFKFIVRSRLLFVHLYDGKGQQPFEEQLRGLLHSIVELTSKEVQHLLLIQGACLRYLPSAVQDIIKVFDARELSSILASLIQGIPQQRLVKQNLMSINDIVKGPLFLRPDARAVFLPAALMLLKTLLEAKEEGPGFHQQTKSAEKLSRVLGASRANWVKAPYCRETEVDLCVKVLSDIMELLFRKDIGPTMQDVTVVMLTVLRTVIQAFIVLNQGHPNTPLVVIMLSIFRQMTEQHFNEYVTNFKTANDRLDFLMEILQVFKELVSRPVFPTDWCEMIMLQNSVILKAMRFFSHTIRDYFCNPFDHQAWNNFFHCAISFLTQNSLQLEFFSPNKRLRIIGRYSDMRRETGSEICSMWFNLGQYKIQFVPGLVGTILEMTLIPEVELRTSTIPIFFDMMQCEYYSSKNALDNHFTKRDSTLTKGHFLDFENEMISKLDALFECGCGDEDYKDLFRLIMLNLCEHHAAFKTQGVKFVETVTRLMERLLEYRTIITDENKENRMSCVVNLLDFYSEINRKEMYIRYVNKLCELHLECDNYTEAAFTLQLHSKLLKWSDENLSPFLKSKRHPDCQTHLELKEALYHDSIRYFDRGKVWECALVLCNELKEQYEDFLYDYRELSQLYKTMATFYENIMTKARAEPEYFRVGFFGRGFPRYLQNKVFIYRGREYERLSEFNNRIMNQFPNAELMTKLEQPSNALKEGPNQMLQINKVDPVMVERKGKTLGTRAPESIIKYHRVNNVSRFQYSRPIYDGSNDIWNMWLERTTLVTTYPLPGILMWFPVNTQRTHMVSPIEHAVETMQTANRTLKELVTNFTENQTLPLNPLTMKIAGIVDPAVMGGISNYEKSFLTPEYADAHQEDQKLIEELKKCIAQQVPLIERCFEIHSQRITPDMEPFHIRLDQLFKEMKANIQAKYGMVSLDEMKLLKLPNTGTIRRQMSLSINGSLYSSERSSVNSLTPSEAGSLTTPLKTLILKTPALSTGTLKSKDKGKEKRKSKSNSKDLSNTSTSQWYTTTSTPDTVYELRQDLQPKRPLRSEVEREKRMSRPTSGQFRPPPGSRLSQVSANRDSTGTTESTTSEEDPTPPPLPVKQRNADYAFLPELNGSFRGAPPKPPL